METISVVLTKYTDPLSKLVYLITGRGYTHASIALGREDGRMYSFNMRGFCVETVEKHRRRGVTRSMSMRFQVSDASYARLRRRIEQIEKDRKAYTYTRLGVVLSLLHIPKTWDKRYFCSQFVAEMLHASGALRLKKAPVLYMPNHFQGELLRSAQLSGVRYNFI